MAKRRIPPRRKRKGMDTELLDRLAEWLRAEEFEKVVSACQREARRAVLSAACLGRLAIAQNELGRHHEALVSLNQAISRMDQEKGSPLDLTLQNDLAKTYYLAGRYAEAADVVGRLSDDYPDQVEFAWNLIRILRADGRLGEAAEQGEVFCRRWPQDAQFAMELAALYRDEGNWQAAERAFRRCLDFESERVAAYRGLVTCYRQLHDASQLVSALSGWLEEEPGNAVALHLLAAVNDEDAPERASDEYIQDVFDRFAETFDRQLSELEYVAPQRIAEILAEMGITQTSGLRVLDAGCGTGLMAQHLRGYASELTGVDLSKKMLKQAAERGYDRLVHQELVEFLEQHAELFDVIVSADTFNYFGDLRSVLQAANRALGGDPRLLVFTVEKQVDDSAQPHGFRLNTNGRYTHDERYLRDELRECGFENVTLRAEKLRRENEIDVLAFYGTAYASRPEQRSTDSA